MMKTFSTSEKVAAYAKLTAPEKSVVNSESVADAIAAVAKKYNLDDRSATILRFTVGFYLLRLVSEDELPLVIKERLPGQSTFEIFSDIKKNVFTIIESEKRSYQPLPEKGSTVLSEEDRIEGERTLLKLSEGSEEGAEESIDRDELLRAIEDPTSPHTSPAPVQATPAATAPVGFDKYREPITDEPVPSPISIPSSAEDRLKGMVFTSQETKNVVVDKPMVPGEKLPPAPKPTLPRYVGPDPYREEAL